MNIPSLSSLGGLGPERTFKINHSTQGWITERAYRAHELRGPLSHSLCVKSLLCISYLWLKEVKEEFCLFAVGFNWVYLRCQGHNYRQCSCTGALGQSRPPYNAFLISACLSASLCKHACDQRWLVIHAEENLMLYIPSKWQTYLCHGFHYFGGGK